MIRLNCTQCKAQLSIDDAFAGGVCRCQYCGTIQTVPKHLRDPIGGSGALAGKGRGAPAARRPRGDAGGSSGLDALANVVAGSGLAATAGRSRPEPAKPLPPVPQALASLPEPPPEPSTRTGLPVALIIIALVILLLLGMLVGLLLKNRAGG